jgi:glycosyltransferase involved in cell wall biosynthesis
VGRLTDLGGYTLVATDGTRWFGLRQRHQHLMQGLSRHFGRTLYIEPSASIARILIKRDFPLDELWAHRRPPLKLGEKLWLIKTPPGMPRALGMPRVNRRNYRAIAGRIKRHLRPGEKVVLWLGGPKAADITDFLDVELVVYDCYDAFTTFIFEAPYAAHIDKLERRLLASSDIILTTSVGLKEKAGHDDARVHLVRNACDYEHFATPRQPPPDFKPVIDLNALRKPRLGYMGDIADWLDQGLIRFLAESRPEWSFVFFGPRKHDISTLTALRNVHFPGSVPYDELPYYLHHFDCMLIPFVLNDLTKEVNPVKMYEYLAMGAPIVSAAMPEVVRYEEVVGIGRSREDFLDKIEQALKTDSEELRGKRRSVARENSWDARIKAVAEIISDALDAK